MSFVEDIAIRGGSYIPRGAGMGKPYLYLGVGLGSAPEKTGYQGASAQRDEYIPSFPELSVRFNPATAGANEPEMASDGENAQKTDENSDSAGNGEFTPEEQRVINDLKVRDREVRAHEQAHISAGGAYIRGGASYEYEAGPDKKRYAVGGEVGIDASPIRDNPQATIAKMQIVRAAALAPANPSGQDRAVAASASQSENQARAELAEKRAAEAQGGDAGGAQNINEYRVRSKFLAGAAAAYADFSGARTPQPVINIAV